MKANQIIENLVYGGLLTSAILMTGCNSTSTTSEVIQTEGIWAKMEVTANDDGRSRVVVELNVGGEFGTNVELTANEYLEVSANGITARLSEDNDIFDIDYQTYLDTTESDTEFNIRFYRANGEAITNSFARLPEAFSITSPQSSEEFSYQDVVTLNWTPSQVSGSIRLVSIVECYTINGGRHSSAQSLDTNDDGTYQFVIEDHAIFSNGFGNFNRNRNCHLDFELERERGGTVDSQFERDSFFKTSQVRSLKNVQVKL